LFNLVTQVAFITGITGQDGSYLAELLLAKGYEVHGLIRRSSSFNTGRLNDIYQDPHVDNRKMILHYGDLQDSTSLANLIREIKPKEIYNLGAQSHVKVSFEIPEYTADITGTGTIRLLEAIRASGIETKFYQASSSELYGSTPPPQNEQTPFHPRSPYGSAKIFSYWSTVNYREAYGMHASNGILFNHESPRRGETFVTRKITRAVARIAAGIDKEVFLGNLDAVRDWGFAKEYVEAMWLMLQQPKGDDFVIATGESATVKQFAEVAFSRANLDWQKYVKLDKRYLRPSEVDSLVGDASKAEKILGWKPKTNWKKLAEIMVDADIKLLDDKLSGKRIDD
jgi:GDPmannose 4,6-dehydratase